MQDVNAPESLRGFQISYGKYLRDPEHVTLPQGVPSRRSEIYEHLLFNNISGFIDNCFPVSKTLFEANKWKEIRRAFFNEWRCETPIFSQIPYEFVRYISERPIGKKLPVWLPELLHYEWIELEVDLDKACVNEYMSFSNLNVNPSARLLAYEWPVHEISDSNRPVNPKQTCLVVYRDVENSVRFNEINATTLLLLQYIQEWRQPINNLNELEHLMHDFAEKISHPDAAALIDFGVPLLKDLKQKEILTGDIF